MTLDFAKMNGAGNDFVFIDNRSRQIELKPAQIVRLCDRHQGVGADGVILLVPCASGRADWAWDFYNSDGSSAEMCGNGARCFARFVRRLTGGNGPISFETRAGVITARFQGPGVTVTLTPPKDLRLRQQVQLSVGPTEIHSLNTGVPHAKYALLCPTPTRRWCCRWARKSEIIRIFAPRGLNVNFVQVLGAGPHPRVRTDERGGEGAPLACGTGVTASSLNHGGTARFSVARPRASAERRHAGDHQF